MNYYERIQSAIDFAEQNLEKSVTVQDIAKRAYMSVSNFYRLFFAITGFQAKEYLINRRISNAAAEIKNTNFKVIDLAVKFAYESPDSFSRTFKKLAGCNPNAYKHADKTFVFERINVMDKYFINDDDKSAEKYPEIKVMKNLEDIGFLAIMHPTVTPWQRNTVMRSA